MAREILMPKLGLTMTSGLITRWLKDEGDPVQAGEPLLEIETEKLTNTVESPGEGVLLARLGREGESYPVAGVIGYVGRPGEDIPTGGAPLAEAAPTQEAPTLAAAPAETLQLSSSDLSASNAQNAKKRRQAVSPLARKLAAQLGVDYAALAGTGPGGRVVKADILGAASAPAAAPAVPQTPAHPQEGLRVLEVIPYAGMRRAIGDNMSLSASTAPHVTHHVRVDAGELLALRKTVNSSLPEGERVSVTDLLIKLVASSLARMPVVNAALLGGEIHCYGDVNIALAVALPRGLVVPVIRNADKKSLLTVSAEARSLIAGAREGRLSPDDFAGGTFTLSNLGGYGSVDFFTPIINPPQAAILGVGRTVDTVVPLDGQPVIRPMMGLSLSYDHRVIDGATAAEFARLLIDLMKKPVLALA